VIGRFRTYASSVIPEKRATQIKSVVLSLDDNNADFNALLDLLTDGISD